MRDYTRKAKRIDNGEWIEGYLFFIADTPYIICDGEEMCMDGENADLYATEWYTVDENTICEPTGLTDMNDNKIWENDIASFKHRKFYFDDGLEPWQKTCLPNKKEYKRNYVVEFCNTPTHYGLRFRNGSIWFMVHKMTIYMHDAEVIGNIFDNADLLKDDFDFDYDDTFERT